MNPSASAIMAVVAEAGGKLKRRKEMESKFLSKGTVVQINGEDVVVRPLPLKRYKELIEGIADLLSSNDIEALTGGNPTEAIKKLAMAPEKLAKLCEIATGVNADKVLESSLEDAMGLIGVAIEVNKIGTVFKDALGKLKGPSAEPTTP